MHKREWCEKNVKKKHERRLEKRLGDWRADWRAEGGINVGGRRLGFVQCLNASFYPPSLGEQPSVGERAGGKRQMAGASAA